MISCAERPRGVLECPLGGGHVVCLSTRILSQDLNRDVGRGSICLMPFPVIPEWICVMDRINPET
jgi:hypothetical protein